MSPMASVIGCLNQLELPKVIVPKAIEHFEIIILCMLWRYGEMEKNEMDLMRDMLSFGTEIIVIIYMKKGIEYDSSVCVCVYIYILYYIACLCSVIQCRIMNHHKACMFMVAMSYCPFSLQLNQVGW